MSLTIVPMVAPKVLEDMLAVMGKPNRVRLTGSYKEGEEAVAKQILAEEGFVPDNVRVNLEVFADKMTVKQILALYRKDYADFQEMLSSTRKGKRERQSRLGIKEFVWFKNEVKDGVSLGDKEYYYLTFDRYHFHGRIDTRREPELIQKILGIMEKYNMPFSVHIGS